MYLKNVRNKENSPENHFPQRIQEYLGGQIDMIVDKQRQKSYLILKSMNIPLYDLHLTYLFINNVRKVESNH